MIYFEIISHGKVLCVEKKINLTNKCKINPEMRTEKIFYFFYFLSQHKLCIQAQINTSGFLLTLSTGQV